MKTTEYSDLPSELIDEIFDALWISSVSSYTTRHQKALLRSCLPVSTDFRRRIMSRFCSHVHLFDNDERCITRLRELISRPPDSRLGGIGRYIKHFSLKLKLPNRKWDATDPRILRRIMYASHLPAIVEGLHGEDFGVTQFSLTISKECLDSNNALWIDLPADFRSAFRSLLHSPYLTQLNLKNLTVPENIFSGSFLQDLSIAQALRHITANPRTIQELDLVPISLSPFPSLVALCTDYSHEVYSTPLPISMLDKLKVLKELPNKFLNSERTWRILEVSASSLTEIYIDHTGEVVKPPEAFNLGAVHNLKVFEYSRRFCDDFPFDESNDLTPSILFHLFHVTEPMENLESIKINFHLKTDLLDNYFLRFHPEWALLDADLSSTSHFPSLIQFGIDIAITLPYLAQNLRQYVTKKNSDVLKSSFPHILATETISFCPTTNLLPSYY